jgi:hypothetical protein
LGDGLSVGDEAVWEEKVAGGDNVYLACRHVHDPLWRTSSQSANVK